MELEIIDGGTIEYKEAYEYQKALREERIQGKATERLILLEHPPTITLGRRGKDQDVLIDAEEARSRGVSIVHIDRGGEATYHGPGQLVGYLVFHLSVTEGSIRRFVDILEGSIIIMLSEYGIKAGQMEQHRGVWVGNEKIAALGLSVSKNVTMHGFALNVFPDLGHFKWIIPCGIRDKGVTSMKRILGTKPDFDEVKRRTAECIRSAFGFDPRVAWRNM